jgi:8-oxo-dGTP pyrophosphatase MutT (NUDIX family)
VVRYEAGGCVVVRDDGRVMVLHRHGETRLPKGHVEEGEAPAEAAVRELAEESGHDHVELLGPAGAGTVAFDRLDRDDGSPVRIERTESWFLARLLSDRTVDRPVADRDWVVGWLTWDEAITTLTYEPEQGWARWARAAWTDLTG